MQEKNENNIENKDDASLGPQSVSINHFHIHFHDLDENLARELALNLALDLKRTQEKINLVHDEIHDWQQRLSGVAQFSEPEIKNKIHERIQILRQEMSQHEKHKSDLEQEIKIVHNQATSSGKEHEIKRQVVRQSIEQMLGQKMDDILMEEKIADMEKNKKADQELDQLKQEMGRSKNEKNMNQGMSHES